MFAITFYFSHYKPSSNHIKCLHPLLPVLCCTPLESPATVLQTQFFRLHSTIVQDRCTCLGLQNHPHDLIHCSCLFIYTIVSLPLSLPEAFTVFIKQIEALRLPAALLYAAPFGQAVIDNWFLTDLPGKIMVSQLNKNWC